MDRSDWPLCPDTTHKLSALEGRGVYRSVEEEDLEPQPTPQPPSSFSADDYRSILKAQSPFGNTTVDEYVLGMDFEGDNIPIEQQHYTPPLALNGDMAARSSATFEQHQQLLPSINFAAHYSPSLSSSVTTLPSSPESAELRNITSWPFSEVTAHLEPLRTKRKFSSLRTAKRLPRRHSPPWEVHALIQVRTNEFTAREYHQIHPPGGSSRAHRTANGLGLQHTGTGINIPGLDLRTSEPEKWSNSFVHYRGASFEVINPHASLLYGARSFETPAAEIDGLLDDYFDLSEQLDQDMDHPASAPASTPGDLTPSRQLYDDPEIARRKILGLAPQAAPLIEASENSTSQQANTETHSSEAEINEIVAGYDHPTYPPTTRPISTESSDTEFLEYLYEAHEESPDMPILMAYKESLRQQMQEQQGSQPQAIAGPSSRAAEIVRAGNTYDMPTSERTYGDTNRLLGISPYSAGLKDTLDQPGSGESTPRQPSMWDGSFVDGAHRCDIEQHDSREVTGVSSRQASIHRGDTPDPDMQGEASNTSLNTVVHHQMRNPFDSEYDHADHDAEWVTDNEDDAAHRAARESAGSSKAAYSLYRAYANQSEATATMPAQPVALIVPAVPDPAEVQHVVMLLSTAMWHKSQIMGSGNSIAVHSSTAEQHRRAASDAEILLRRIQHEKPAVFEQGVDKYSKDGGQMLGLAMPSIGEEVSDNVSENSLDMVLRKSRELESHPSAALSTANYNNRRAGLEYSPTQATFTTVRQASPTQAPQYFVKSGLSPPVPKVMPLPGAPSPWERPDVWRQGPSKQQEKRHHKMLERMARSMASVNSQTGLKDLHLNSSPTSNIGQATPDLPRRPGTPLFPRALAPVDSPLRPRTTQSGRPVRPHRYPDDDLEMSELTASGQTILGDARVHAVSLQSLSRDLVNKHLCNPIALLLIYWGCCDGRIARQSRGAARGVTYDQKAEAIKWAILEIVGLIIFAGIIAIVVVAANISHNSTISETSV